MINFNRSVPLFCLTVQKCNLNEMSVIIYTRNISQYLSGITLSFNLLLPFVYRRKENPNFEVCNTKQYRPVYNIDLVQKGNIALSTG